MGRYSYTLEHVPDNLKEMCDKVVGDDPSSLQYVPNHFKTQKMCKKVVEKNSWYLGHVPDQYKTEEMCNKPVCTDTYKLKLIPDDHFKILVKQEIEMWNGIMCYRLCMFFVPDCFFFFVSDTRDVQQVSVHKSIQARICTRLFKDRRGV